MFMLILESTLCYFLPVGITSCVLSMRNNYFKTESNVWCLIYSAQTMFVWLIKKDTNSWSF